MCAHVFICVSAYRAGMFKLACLEHLTSFIIIIQCYSLFLPVFACWCLCLCLLLTLLGFSSLTDMVSLLLLCPIFAFCERTSSFLYLSTLFPSVFYSTPLTIYLSIYIFSLFQHSHLPKLSNTPHHPNHRHYSPTLQISYPSYSIALCTSSAVLCFHPESSV